MTRFIDLLIPILRNMAEIRTMGSTPVARFITIKKTAFG
jgi:hypothetical protein